MSKNLILIGGGGHCRSCIDVIEQEDLFKIMGIVDLKEKIGQKVFDYKIIGSDDELQILIKKYKYCFVTLGQIKSFLTKMELFEKLISLGALIPVIISPLSYVSKHANLDDGTIIMHGAIVNANARIGRNCIINTGTIIEHDAIIEDHCHISTNSVINGGTKIGKGSFIGSGSVLKENIEICPEVIIGAGSLVLNSITESAVYYGIPAKRQAKNG